MSGFRAESLGWPEGALLGPVDPSFRALSGRLYGTVRRHEFKKDSLLSAQHFNRSLLVAAKLQRGGAQNP